MAVSQGAQYSKTIRANVVTNLIRTLAMTILSFVTFPYVTRALGEQTFGLYTWANTFVYYFLILAKISIPNLAIRECSKVKNDKEKLSHLTQQFFLLQGIMTVISFVLMATLVLSIASLRENGGLIFLLSINFLIGVFSFEWIYVVLEKHFYITIRSVVLIAFAALLTFAFIKVQNGYLDENGVFVNPSLNEVHIYALIAISTTIFTAILNTCLLPRYISLKKTAPYDFKPFIKPLLSMFFVSMALTLYNQTDEFLLGYIDSSKAAVGSYSVGVKGIDIIITLITSLFVVFMPRASFYYEKENKVFFQNLLNYSFGIAFFIAIPAIATMSALSHPITSLISGSELSNQYQESSLVLSILCLTMLTYSLGDSIYTQILLPMKKEKFYFYGLSGGVLLNIGLSLALALTVFKNQPAIGVGIATMVTDLLLLVFLIAVTKKYSVPAIFNWNNAKIVGMGLLIGVLTYFLSPLLINALPYKGDELWKANLIALIVMVAGDAIFYLGGLALLKEHLVSSLLHRRSEEA